MATGPAVSGDPGQTEGVGALSSAAMLVRVTGAGISDDDDLQMFLQRVVDSVGETIAGADHVDVTVILDAHAYRASRGLIGSGTCADHLNNVPVLSAALGTPDQSLGALTVHGSDGVGFSAADAALLELSATTVTRTIIDFVRVTSVQATVDSLRQALTTRAPVEQAKGILMGELGVDATAAFAVLRARSQNSNRRVRDIAADLIDNATTRRAT